MKPLGLILVLLLVTATYGASAAQNEDDFSEFDDFDEDPVAHKAAEEDDFDDEEEEFVHEPPVKKVEIDVEDAEAVVEDVDSEFNHFADEEEFEGFHNEEDEEDEFEHMTTKGKNQFFSFFTNFLINFGLFNRSWCQRKAKS